MCIPPSLSPYLLLSVPPSFPLSLPPSFLPPSLTPLLPPSFPPSFPSSLPSFLSHSLSHSLTHSLPHSLSPSPLQTHLSNQGYLLRFLAMMWTAPVEEMELGPHHTAAQSGSSVLVTPVTQAHSLAVFSSYLKCLSSESILALATHLCPGTTSHVCIWFESCSFTL